MTGPATPGRDREAGSVTAFVLVFSFALIVLAGLVFDGGMGLSAKRRALNVAEQAARAGAQEISIDSVRGSGPIELDPAAAGQAASGFLGQAGYAGSVRVDGNQVEVTVTWSRTTSILGLVGIERFGGTGSATARNCRGVVQEEAC